MMIAVRLCLVLTALLLITGPGRAEEVLGTWTSDKRGMRVKFEPCGDALCGNIVWLEPGSDSKARLGDRLSMTCGPMGRIRGPAKPTIAARSTWARCRSKKGPSSEPLAASSAACSASRRFGEEH